MCRLRLASIFLAAFALASCQNSQSVLAPAGREASQLASLFWVLVTGAAVIWLTLNGLFVYFLRVSPRQVRRRTAEAVIIGGGILFPVVVLAALLWWSLSLMPEQRAEGDGDLTIRVTGEQFWWRVEYWPKGADEPIVSANEIRLPLGSRTEVKLGAEKVIHSFWIPALAGKMDMFPGRETRIALEPTRTGIFRGQCAEYCGTSHALMAFQAVVMEEDEFGNWLEEQAGTAAEPGDARAARGREVFLANGCGGCHAVRGTAARSTFGPDLTHVGGRESLGAGILPTDPEAFAKWMRHLEAIKPGTDMPTYEHLEEDDLEALAYYLEGLK